MAFRLDATILAPAAVIYYAIHKLYYFWVTFDYTTDFSLQRDPQLEALLSLPFFFLVVLSTVGFFVAVTFPFLVVVSRLPAGTAKSPKRTTAKRGRSSSRSPGTNNRPPRPVPGEGDVAATSPSPGTGRGGRSGRSSSSAKGLSGNKSLAGTSAGLRHVSRRFFARLLFWAGILLLWFGNFVHHWAHYELGRNWFGLVRMRKKDHELITTGCYGYVRHPLYSGMLAFAFAAACLASSRKLAVVPAPPVSSSIRVGDGTKLKFDFQPARECFKRVVGDGRSSKRGKNSYSKRWSGSVLHWSVWGEGLLNEFFVPHMGGLVWLCAIGLVFVVERRGRLEEEMLVGGGLASQYAVFRETVRWRLVPGIV